MILVGLGANLPSPMFGAPARTLEAALGALEAEGIRVVARSRPYRSAPIPASDQPWFVNAVARLETGLSPGALLDTLLDLERRFGRIRGTAKAPRMLDLDLLAYHRVVTAPDAVPALPHPRLRGRGFVLVPLAEIAPGWRHPVTGETVAALLGGLPKGQAVEPMIPS
ncbi:MAG TPA: 2-amino-4-hydroxy-6-hydroxymethyldihydropteridine diphosphokinase [Alphaproteobacteria bacterium]